MNDLPKQPAAPDPANEFASDSSQIDPRDFTFKQWTGRSYYEVCSNPDVYELIEAATQRSATSAGS